MVTCRRVKFLLRMFSVLVIRLRSLRLLRVSGIVMRLRMFLLLITFLKASHSFRKRLLVICKNAYLFATMIMTSVSSFFFHAEDGIRFLYVTGVQTCALPICVRCRPYEASRRGNRGVRLHVANGG